MTDAPVPVVVQFAVVGAAVLPLLLQSTELLVIVARPMVPLVVKVPPVMPLLVATLVTVPTALDAMPASWMRFEVPLKLTKWPLVIEPVINGAARKLPLFREHFMPWSVESA
jgi:hypothetical protein